MFAAVLWSIAGTALPSRRSRSMSVTAIHQGLPCEMQSLNNGEWQWSFQPTQGARRTGKVVGEPGQAMAVVHRAIEVSMPTNAA